MNDPTLLLNTTMEKTHSLHLTDNSSIHTQRTQLDIEESENSGSNSNHHNDEGYDITEEEDDEDLPPLSTYLAGWKFWCRFALWPFVFFTINAIIVFTLIAFSEYDFQYGKHGIRNRYSSRSYSIEPWEMDNVSRDNSNVRYEMLKYNRMVVAILLLVDAVIVYYSVTYLEKKVRELDMIGTVNDSNIDGTSTNTIGILSPNIHAQVSRKLDAVLGRSTTCRVSILVSILWLLFVSCTTVGIVSVADLLFAMSPKGKTVCNRKHNNGMNKNNNNNGATERMNDDDASFDYNRTKPKKPIKDIPDELQEWAQERHSPWTESRDIVHLTNGVTYFAAANPSFNMSSSRHNFMENELKRQLVSVGPDGVVQFYENVINPSSFSSFTNENGMNTSSFCCYYREKPENMNQYNFEEIWYSGGIYKLLCTKSSHQVVDGIFPNETIFKKENDEKSINMNFDGISFKSYNNALWLQLITMDYDMYNGREKSTFIFYNVTYEDKLVITKVTQKSFSGYDYYGGEEINVDFSDPFLLGPGSACYRWTRNIDVAAFVVSFTIASVWLTQTKNLSVGIVPAVAAVAMLLTRINHELGLALCSIGAVATIIGLLGCIPIPISREKLVWALYTLQCWIAGLIFSGSFYMYYDGAPHFIRALATIVVSSFIGFILNHPVLYLFGWIGGIWSVFCGFFLLFLPYSFHAGVFAIILGIIMGSGCVTVGFNLIIYRAHCLYYSKRAWYAMNTAMQNVNTTRGSTSSSGYRRTNNATAYSAVMHVPHDSPIRSPAPVGKRENDITSGLLNIE